MKKHAGLHDFAGWKAGRDNIKAGNVSYGWSNTSIPGVFAVELKSADGQQCYGWVWIRHECGNVICICQSYIIEPVRRCGARTLLHRKILEWFPSTRMIVTARATQLALPWLLKTGFIFNEEFDRWEYSVPKVKASASETSAQPARAAKTKTNRKAA